jgi:transcription antitermination factor NusG
METVMSNVGSDRAVQPWFALQTRQRYEEFVAKQLRGKGFAPFVPMYTTWRRWSDRTKEVTLPLFPGYVFCRFNPMNRLPILTSAGVIQVVGAGKNPTAIEDDEIAAIQRADSSGLPRQPWPYLGIGEKVKVVFGPLSGLEGILTDYKGFHRLILSVNLLQRSVAVTLDRTWVLPATPQYRAPIRAALPPAA